MSSHDYVLNATTGAPMCIASDDIPLWECPCGECTRLDWDALDDTDQMGYGSLRVWREIAFPEVWGRA